MTSLGLQRGKVRLDDYNPEWEKEFDKEKLSLQKIIGEKLLGTEHIGSTSIPGIKAKPILDLMIAITDLDDWQWLEKPLKQLKYEFKRDVRTEQGHILFVKGPDENRTHYLKVTEIDSDFWIEHILFRDYLINNPKYRKEYEALKEKLLKDHKGNRALYTKDKEDFIKKILKLAGFEGKVL